MELRSNQLVDLNEQEQQDINGGIGILGVVGLVMVGIVADEVVERTTGSDIATHVGNGLTNLGNWIAGN